ncbi:LamB/YcsF family protein [Haloferula sargassicola]|uniref:5-oxoprolinase subunit A n=1 Tax=Haloferula sargassicola TaxID=490096 RepID=A0ABP9UI81_9BACT
MQRIDLNVDLGEGGDADARLIALASSVNIACGGHAGDASTLRSAMELAAGRGVAVGAHPGWEDPEHFGRRPLDLSAAELAAALDRQLGRFAEMAATLEIVISHVKPHGALYHQADAEHGYAAALLDAMERHAPGAAVTVPPRGLLQEMAGARGVAVIREGFADRRYGSDGRLVPRSEPDAVLTDPHQAVSQAIELAPRVDTLCVHGDGAAALRILTAVREGLLASGWSIRPPQPALTLR